MDDGPAGLGVEKDTPKRGLLLLTGGLEDTDPDGTYPRGLGVETSIFEYTGFSTAYCPENCIGNCPGNCPEYCMGNCPGNGPKYCTGNCPGSCPEYCMGLPSPGGTAGYSVGVTVCVDLSLSPEAPWV
jgi:hypothetical protein